MMIDDNRHSKNFSERIILAADIKGQIFYLQLFTMRLFLV